MTALRKRSREEDTYKEGTNRAADQRHCHYIGGLGNSEQLENGHKQYNFLQSPGGTLLSELFLIVAEWHPGYGPTCPRMEASFVSPAIDRVKNARANSKESKLLDSRRTAKRISCNLRMIQRRSY